MHKTVIRRAMAVGVFLAVSTTVAAGCSSSNDSSADTTSSSTSTTSSSAAATTSPELSAAATTEITNAYITFFDGAGDPAARAALVENGDLFLPTLQGMTADPQSMATSATVQGVVGRDATNADVTWTLQMDGNPVLPDQAGEAVQQDGTWKVAATTFCALMAIQGSGAAIPGC